MAVRIGQDTQYRTPTPGEYWDGMGWDGAERLGGTGEKKALVILGWHGLVCDTWVGFNHQFCLHMLAY